MVETRVFHLRLPKDCDQKNFGLGFLLSVSISDSSHFQKKQEKYMFFFLIAHLRLST